METYFILSPVLGGGWIVSQEEVLLSFAAGISLAIISVVNGPGTSLRTKFTSIGSSLK